MMTDEREALSLATNISGLIVDGLRDIVASVILHGSLALGCYEAGRSDIDLLVVFVEDLDSPRKRWLFDNVRDLLSPLPTALDLRVVTRASAAAPQRVPAIDLEIAAHPPQNELQVVADGVEDPDLLVEFAVCRAYGRALHGLGPRAVIGSVDPVWLLEDADEELTTWQRVHADGIVAPIVPLTACRIWLFASKRIFCSKHDAVRWVLDRLPGCDIAREALRAHQGERDGDLKCEGLPELLTAARVAVREALSQPGSPQSSE